MYNIVVIALFLIFSANILNQASGDSILGSSENESGSNSNETNTKNDTNRTIQNQLDQYPSIDPAIDEDAKLNVPQLITKYGYKVEEHYVTTEDGYIIQLHRIVGGAKSPPRKGKRVVYWMHGLTDSSALVIVSGPHHSLGYLLVDNDFDVWLGNARGTIYSTNHTTLNPFGSRKERKRFWSFSWHEIGVYDLPASIDYILAKTEQPKLQYIGHSQGGTVFFVMASERPEYNDKIEMMHGLAPSGFLTHTISPLIRAIVSILPFVQRMRELIGVHYISPSKEFNILAGELLCRDKVPTQFICENLLFLYMGYECDQMNGTLLPVILGHAKFLHYGQEINSGHFRQYDHGRKRNLRKYKRSTPPDYNLKKVRAPVAIFYSQNDWLASVEDTHRLIRKLPNVVKRYLVPHKQFNHLDFILGSEAPALLFDEILKTMKAA